MKRVNINCSILLIVTILLLSSHAMGDNCMDCHQSWEEGSDSPSALYEQDVHFKAGLGCSSCHGGNPELEDMDEVRQSPGFKGVPTIREIPEFCAACHSDPNYMVKHNPSLPTDQLEKYKTSVHGKRLFENGDTKVATCISCHSVHNIQKPEIPTSTVYAVNIPATCATCHANPEHMKGYGIPTDQYDLYSQSVHGVALLVDKDLGAPACNDCHGNHGAIPPGVKSISAVCGLCHALVATKFNESPHRAAFDAVGIPECEVCHSNHLVKKPELSWVGTSDSALCIDCHTPDDGTIGLTTAATIHQAIIRLQLEYDSAEAVVDEADEKGMLVTDERFTLKEANQAIIQAATAVHTFNADSVQAVTDVGMTKAAAAYKAGVSKIGDYYFRRKGLGIATLIITLLAIGLYLKIRSTEK